MGAPKGSTIKAKQDMINLRRKAVDKVTLAYKTELDAKENLNASLPKGTLDVIIAQTGNELKLPAESKINKERVKNCMRKRTQHLTPKHPGTKSPL